MSTYYLSIVSVQAPFPFNTDANGRVMFSFNILAQAEAASDSWEWEVAKILTDAGVATALNTDLFIGPAARIPDGDGPYISILVTQGLAPRRARDQKYESLSAQIVVRAAKYLTARDKALAAWRALDGKFNTTVAA